ncbi:MAG: histone deacetylase [Candidatus Eisenbacteria bacterium]
MSADGAPLLAWTSDHVTLELPEGHAFPIVKYRLLREKLLAERVLDPAHLTYSDEAPDAWLTAVHDAGYVARASAGGLDAAEVRRLGLPWSPELVRRARAAVFGTVQSARAALRHGLAGSLSGGTHHAFRDRGEAYCLFHDQAVAIELLRGEGAIARPFVLDLDVHQGNGTAAIFAGDDAVFTYSLHGRHNYPYRKETSTLDVELDDGAGDDAVLAALDATVPAALDRHAPDLVLYQAGVDALASDRLGRLRMTHAGLAERDRRVFAWCAARGLPVAFAAGGGYARPIDDTVEAYANTWRQARLAHAGRDGREGVAGR